MLPPRVCIVGGSKTGKSTLADRLGGEPGVKLFRSDDLIASHAWSEASAEVANWMSEPPPWILEGVAVVRALRKWLARDTPGTPCDLVVVCTRVWVPLSEGQRRMNKGHEKVWGEVEPELRRRGVEIRTYSDVDEETAVEALGEDRDEVLSRMGR